MWIGCPRIEGARVYPRSVTFAATCHTHLTKREHRDQIVLSARHNVLGVGRPADAQQAAEIALHRAAQVDLQLLIALIDKREHSQVAVLANNGQIGAARREGELVDPVGARIR